ncbi:MAG TPA: NAD-dependent epimerase/dehydratase family protein [Bacteroidales bacterium]|nr:NAD-dependent epimerase/dehydratase family protein [Bacteroidales bacterium]
MIIAVTGANGHVGVNLCKALKEAGHEVRALTHQNDYALRHIDVTPVKGDLLVKETLIPFVGGADIVFHLAAKISIRGDRDGSVTRLNIEGTRNIVEASRNARVKRLIHFSSIHAFNHEPLDEVLNETRPLVGDDGFAYDRSKAEGERIVRQAAAEGMDALVLSPTAIIGPMDFEPSLTGKAFLELYHRQIPALVPGGYNWVDVRDVVSAAIAAIEKGRTGEKYLVAGTWRSIGEVARLIEKQTGSKTTKVIMPFWVARVGLPFITLYSRITGADPLYTSESLEIISKGSRHISNEKARKELGFNPRPLEDTIADIFQWFAEAGYLKPTS